MVPRVCNLSPLLLLVACGARTPDAAEDFSCATRATPDLKVDFTPPTDLGVVSEPYPGADYGQTDCSGRFVVEIRFGAASGLYVSALPTDTSGWTFDCDFVGNEILFGRLTGTNHWEIVDVLETASKVDGSICTTTVVSRKRALPEGATAEAPFGYVPPDRYDRVRVAAKATTAAGKPYPLNVRFYYPTP